MNLDFSSSVSRLSRHILVRQSDYWLSLLVNSFLSGFWLSSEDSLHDKEIWTER